MSTFSPLGSSLNAANAAVQSSSSATSPGSASPLGDAGRAWFAGMGDAPAPTLRAETEPQAKGLGASAHAERVLSHLIEDV